MSGLELFGAAAVAPAAQLVSGKAKGGLLKRFHGHYNEPGARKWLMSTLLQLSRNVEANARAEFEAALHEMIRWEKLPSKDRASEKSRKSLEAIKSLSRLALFKEPMDATSLVRAIELVVKSNYWASTVEFDFEGRQHKANLRIYQTTFRVTVLSLCVLLAAKAQHSWLSLLVSISISVAAAAAIATVHKRYLFDELYHEEHHR